MNATEKGIDRKRLITHLLMEVFVCAQMTFAYQTHILGSEFYVLEISINWDKRFEKKIKSSKSL